MSKFKVGDEVLVPGLLAPRRVLEVWKGKKQPRYLLGREEQEGIYRVDQLVDEDKLQPA